MPGVQTPPSRTRACPKCAFVSDLAIDECPACGVVISKFQEMDESLAPAPSGDTTRSVADKLTETDRLLVQQDVERLEAWTGFETANQYTVRDGRGSVLFDAAEESGSAAQLIGRLFLKAQRPFTIHLHTPEGEPMLTVERPFRFYFYEVTVRDAQGRELGKVERQFSLVNKRYLVTSATDGTTFEVFGPLFRPWTFKIRQHDRECGVITKKWNGLAREAFTDADRFGVELPYGTSVELKAVFLGAVFLIDFCHFENNNG